ncbi:MAG TPA: asparagine synthase (glutamine-hydrolyzing) [Myxococcota bacterium]|nr:asparagine synthase (glutamine-hydrolyzing) [Myxococcota bacterium]
MCGILGQVETRGRVDEAAFARMLSTLATRGPDGERTRVLDQGRVALGHRRLAIVDLSDAGSQPMTSEDGTLWLTFNGEIYNFRELRKELEAAGHVFRSASDSEAILHAYEEWHDDCLLRLRGIFAFGLWDGRRARLLLGRDRLGVKPLYYWLHEGGLVFASQSRAILQHPRFRREVDRDAFQHYLVYRYVPDELAIWKGVRKLPAAHRLVFERGAARRDRYWELAYSPRVRDAEQAAALVREKLEESVRMQLVSDVPVGVFLSGGIDSSITAALATRASAPGLPSFTLGFDDASADERAFARRTSVVLGTRPHEDVLSAASALRLLPEFAELHDEPFFDHSSLPTLCVARLARRHGVKVILSGDGGDELFAGYSWYERGAEPGPAWRRWLLPRSARTRALLAGHLARVSPLGRTSSEGLVPGAPRFDALRLLRRFDQPTAPAITRLQLLDLHTFLVDDVLTKVDQASMACGVEVRVPFLDHELVEAAFSIDAGVLFAAGERKSLLKRVASGWLPADILSGRKKGFGAPIESWMQEGLAPRARSLLEGGVLVSHGLLARDPVRDTLAGGNAARVWLLFAAELWARRWLDPGSRPLRELLEEAA